MQSTVHGIHGYDCYIAWWTWLCQLQCTKHISTHPFAPVAQPLSSVFLFDKFHTPDFHSLLSFILSPFPVMPACTPFITLILTGNSYGYATHHWSHSTSTSLHPAYTSCVFILSLRLLHNQHPYVLWHIHPCILLDPAAPATLVHHCILPVLGAYLRPSLTLVMLSQVLSPWLAVCSLPFIPSYCAMH